MSKKEITFLSSRGRGLSNDLSLVKNHLMGQNAGDIMFRYYLNNELHSNPLAGHGYRRAKKSFAEGMTNAICVDASLSANMKNLSEDGKRILLAVPYDYQFKNMLLMEEKGREFNLNTMARFTHIVAGSPFTAELFKKAYRLENRELVENVALPFAWDTLQHESRTAVQDRIFFYFPQAKRKKILSIIIYGDKDKKRKDWESFDIKEFTKRLGADWFVFTNSEQLMENAFSMSNRYKDCFGYLNRVLPVPELLYLSDVLVTNNGRLASAFSIQNKPVYACRYNDNYFEKYMSFRYPLMYFPQAENLCGCAFKTDVLTGEQKKFCSQMSYQEPISPNKAVTDILGV